MYQFVQTGFRAYASLHFRSVEWYTVPQKFETSDKDLLIHTIQKKCFNIREES